MRAVDDEPVGGAAHGDELVVRAQAPHAAGSGKEKRAGDSR